MQDKTWYSILGLDAEPLFLQDHMLKDLWAFFTKTLKKNNGNGNVPTWIKGSEIKC